MEIGDNIENGFNGFNGFNRLDAPQFQWLYFAVGRLEAEIWQFWVAYQGYLPVGVSCPTIKPGSLGGPGDRNFQHCYWAVSCSRCPTSLYVTIISCFA